MASNQTQNSSSDLADEGDTESTLPPSVKNTADPTCNSQSIILAGATQSFSLAENRIRESNSKSKPKESSNLRVVISVSDLDIEEENKIPRRHSSSESSQFNASATGYADDADFESWFVRTDIVTSDAKEHRDTTIVDDAPPTHTAECLFPGGETGPQLQLWQERERQVQRTRSRLETRRRTSCYRKRAWLKKDGA